MILDEIRNRHLRAPIRRFVTTSAHLNNLARVEVKRCFGQNRGQTRPHREKTIQIAIGELLRRLS